MFGIGSTELLVILVVALIVLGPKSLAGVSRTLGKAMGEFRRASTDFQRAINLEAAQEEAKQKTPRTEAQASDDALPPDSPLAQAIARAKQDASRDSGNKA